MGEKQNIKCSFCVTLSQKNDRTCSGVSCSDGMVSLNAGLRSVTIVSVSSFSNKPAILSDTDIKDENFLDYINQQLVTVPTGRV